MTTTSATPSTSRTQHLPDFEVCKFCVFEMVADIIARINELDRLKTNLARAISVLEIRGVDYENYLTNQSGLPTDIIDALSEYKARRRELKVSEALNLPTIKTGVKTFSSVPHGAFLFNRFVMRGQNRRLAKRWKVSEVTASRWTRQGIIDLYQTMPETYRRDTIPNAQDIFNEYTHIPYVQQIRKK